MKGNKFVGFQARFKPLYSGHRLAGGVYEVLKVSPRSKRQPQDLVILMNADTKEQHCVPRQYVEFFQPVMTKTLKGKKFNADWDGPSVVTVLEDRGENVLVGRFQDGEIQMFSMPKSELGEEVEQ